MEDSSTTTSNWEGLGRQRSLNRLVARVLAPMAAVLVPVIAWFSVDPLVSLGLMVAETVLHVALETLLTAPGRRASVAWLEGLREVARWGFIFALCATAGPGSPSWLWFLMSAVPIFLQRTGDRLVFAMSLMTVASACAGMLVAETPLVDLVVPLTAMVAVFGICMVLVRPLRRAIGELRARGDQLDTVMQAVDSAADAIEISGRDKRIRYVNPAWEQLTGFSAAEAMGQVASELLRITDPRPEPDASGGLRAEQFGRTKDGQRLSMLLTSSAVPGQEAAEVNIRRDLSMQRRVAESLDEARQAAEEASKLQRSFLASVSHELRTPMNGILGMSSILMRSELTDDQQDFVRTIHQSAEGLTQLIGDILDFSRTQQPAAPTRSEPFDLVAEAERVVRLLSYSSSSVRDNHITVYVEPEASSLVYGDKGKARQVLTNLVANALKYGEGSPIAVRVLVGNRGTRLEVADQGPGIEPRHIDRLFEPFWQADATREVGGLGLGLAISHRLMQDMGGSLEVRSTLGAGACFWFELPTAEISPYDEVTEDSEIPAPVPSGCRVLVVEDSPVNQVVMRACLRALEVECAIVSDGPSGIELAEKGGFDAILMDCRMPEMDGFETARRIRAAEADGSRVPIIAITADAREQHAEACLEAGMDAFVPKPITLKQLASILALWLPRKS